MGAIGHPGDIERLRMAAIELASTEGFTRSAADVSLRRLAHYSLSPVMKSAFEQVYGAAVSGADAFRRSWRAPGGGFVFASGIRWRDRDATAQPMRERDRILPCSAARGNRSN